MFAPFGRCGHPYGRAVRSTRMIFLTAYAFRMRSTIIAMATGLLVCDTEFLGGGGDAGDRRGIAREGGESAR